ncbi:MAG: Ig-like domain-containing protein, partial [Bacteroidota bacterium]
SSDCQRVYEYAWTPSSPGDYYIISRIGEGSDSTTYSLDTTIFSVCNPTLTPTLVNPTTGSANGRIDLLLSNSIGDYTYNWTVTGHSAGSSSGSGSGNSITGLHAGTYAVTVNSVNGCQVTASGLVLSAFTAPALTITGKITNNCSGGSGNQGAVEVVVTSANAGPYTYAWSNGATTRTISGLANGTYNVVVTDNYSQSSPSTPFTVATSSAINITESTTDETCSLNNGKIDISVTGGSGSSYSYKWSNGYSIEDIDRISAGAYTVTVTDAAGCTNVLSKTVALTCNRKPLANDDSFSALKGASSITGNLATNDSDPDGNTLAYEKIDEPVGSTQGAIVITSSGGITFTPVSAFVGLLKLRYKITDNGSGSLTDTAIVSLSIYNAGTDTICVSAGTARFAIDADPMYTTYAWTIPQGTSFVGSSTTNAIILNIATATPDTLGDVCVTVGNICGETSRKCYPVFLKKNKPIITAPSVCEGNDVSLTVSQNTTYSWTGPNSFTSNVRNPFLYNVPVSFNGGEYKVTTTDAFGCVGRDSILLQVNSNPTLTAVLTNANCGGADGAINITVSSGVTPTYRWSTGAIVEDLTTITYGNYGVTVTNSTGCAADTMFSIKDIQGPSITLTKTNVLCAQGLTGAIAIVSPHDNATNYSFSWTNGSTANALASIATGDYGVVVTDKATGCHGTANVLITEPDKLTLESTQTNVACAGNTGSITTIGKGGTGAYTYAWSSGPSTASLSSIAAGAYTVTLTDANSCQVIQPFTITAPSTLAATAAAVDVSCNAGTNGKVNLSVTGGSTPYRYLWNNGATTQNIQGLTAATYTVTVTDANNCSVIVSQAVTQLPALAISESITAVLCNSGNNGAINITASGGRTPYTYAWSNGVTTEDLTGLTAQAYVVTVTDANGCTFNKTITVTQPAALSLSSPVTTNVSCFGGTNGGFTVSGSGGTSPLTYKWSTQAAFSSTSIISGLSAGSYSVTVKDANNCEVSSNSLPITQPTAIVVNATLAIDSCR